MRKTSGSKKSAPYPTNARILAHGLFSRADIERKFGWNPKGGHNREWKMLLGRAKIPRDDWPGPFDAYQARSLLRAFYKWMGEREQRKLDRAASVAAAWDRWRARQQASEQTPPESASASDSDDE